MIAFDQTALLLLIAVPLVGAFLSMFMPKDQPKDAWYFALFVSGLTLLISMIAFARYDYTAGGFQFTRTFNWLDAPLNISLSLGLDGISAPLMLLNGIILF